MKSIPEIAKCIKDTYEADAKEVNSLLQLLSIEPAVLPDKVTLSQDSSMILTAINDLNKKITLMMPPIVLFSVALFTDRHKVIKIKCFG